MTTQENGTQALVKRDDPGTLMRQATDVAGVSREIVTKTAMEIQGRKYVKVEGWMAIATAHGCVASARDVERVPGGVRAIGEIRKISDGSIVATAEGFVGEDEPTWFGGETEVWDKVQRKKVPKTLPKRPDYAIRAMAQTRAISRACRSAFAHVVVLIDANLSTTPAEEIPHGGFVDVESETQPRQEMKRVDQPPTHPVDLVAVMRPEKQPEDDLDYGDDARPSVGDWRLHELHFGKNKGKKLGELESKQLNWYINEWNPKEWPEGSGKYSEADLALRRALNAAEQDLRKEVEGVVPL